MSWARFVSRRSIVILVDTLVVVFVAVLAVTAVLSDARVEADVTLLVAIIAVVLTVGNTLFDLYVAPSEKRRERHEARLEEGASKIQQLMGLKATLALDQVHQAWAGGGVDDIADACKTLEKLAEAAWEIAEPLGDPVLVLVGVVMADAGDLSRRAHRLFGVALIDRDSYPEAELLANCDHYCERIQKRLDAILLP
jgi:hypothetical protein